MPFKDIDIDKAIRQNKIETELRKKIAINNKLNTTTLEGYRDKLNAIELVTGKKYDAPSFSERVEQEKSLLPVTNQLEKLQKQIAETPVAQPQPEIVYRNPNAEFLRNRYRTIIGEDLIVENREDITAAIQRIGLLKRDIADKQSQEYKALYDLNEYLKGYRLANFPQRHQQRPRATSIPRRQLPSLPPRAPSFEGEGLFTNLSEVIEKLKVLIGEMSSGNTNVKLKNEAYDILEFLLRAKHINNDQYLKSMNIISKL